MPSDLTVRLTSRIAAVDAEIDRVARNAQDEIKRLKELKQTLDKALKGMTPENEAVIKQLKAEGIL
jgi:hypothetical protein